jgi:hypothetical protein
MHNLIKLKPKQHMMPIELSVNLTAMPTETEIRKQKKTKLKLPNQECYTQYSLFCS